MKASRMFNDEILKKFTDDVLVEVFLGAFNMALAQQS